MNIELLIPIGMMFLGLLSVYAIGFSIGRRSAYKDVTSNLGVPKTERADIPKLGWHAKSKNVLTAHAIK